MTARGLKIFFDGGARPNPGPIAIALVVRGVAHIRRDNGAGTNNDAEWLALIAALEMGLSLDAPDIILIGDSALVINQARGAWKCRSPALQRHRDVFSALMPHDAKVRIRQVARSQNLAGIAMERASGLRYGTDASLAGASSRVTRAVIPTASASSRT